MPCIRPCFLRFQAYGDVRARYLWRSALFFSFLFQFFFPFLSSSVSRFLSLFFSFSFSRSPVPFLFLLSSSTLALHPFLLLIFFLSSFFSSSPSSPSFSSTSFFLLLRFFLVPPPVLLCLNLSSQFHHQVVHLSIFSKLGSSDSASTLHHLSSLRPEIVIPPLLDKLYAALETLTEPHRLTATLNCMVGVSRAMLAGSKHYPEGRLHALPILQMSLPGLDPNDMKKCMVILLALELRQ